MVDVSVTLSTVFGTQQTLGKYLLSERNFVGREWMTARRRILIIATSISYYFLQGAHLFSHVLFFFSTSMNIYVYMTCLYIAYVYMHIHIYVYTYVYAYLYVYIYAFFCVHTHIYIQTHTNLFDSHRYLMR